MNAHTKPSDLLALTPARRKRIERTVEMLIALLDTMDGEPDLESTGDEEAYLAGWSGTRAFHRLIESEGIPARLDL